MKAEMVLYCGSCGHPIGSVIVLDSGKIIGTGEIEARSRKPGELESLRVGACDECYVDMGSFEEEAKKAEEADEAAVEVEGENAKLKEKIETLNASVESMTAEIKALKEKEPVVTSANSITIGEL